MDKEPKNMLIVYRSLPWHKDPDFKQMTYGDVKGRARRIQKNISPGSYIFFQTTKAGVRYITGYFVVDKILTGNEAKSLGFSSDSIRDDVVVIGDKLKSKSGFLLKLNRDLAGKFKSIKFNFNDVHSDHQRISSHTRNFPYISKEDVDMLLGEINRHAIEDILTSESIIPFDEVHRIKETTIRDYLANHPELLNEKASFYDKEAGISDIQNSDDKGRIDLVLKDDQGKLLVMEFKRPNIASEETIKQILKYATKLKNKYPNFQFRFAIAIDKNQITPELNQFAKQNCVEIFCYGFGMIFEKI